MKQEKLEIVLSLTGHVGSNPTISANKRHQLRLVPFLRLDGEDENRAAVRRPQAISPAGCCLARGRIPPSPPEVADSNESAAFSFASSRERPLLLHHRMLYRYSPKKKAGFLQPSKRMYQSFLLRIFSSVSANLASCSFVRFGLPLGCFPARRSFLFS